MAPTTPSKQTSKDSNKYSNMNPNINIHLCIWLYFHKSADHSVWADWGVHVFCIFYCLLPLVTEVLNRTNNRSEKSTLTRLFRIMIRSIRVGGTGRQVFTIYIYIYIYIYWFTYFQKYHSIYIYIYMHKYIYIFRYIYIYMKNLYRNTFMYI